MPDIRFYTPELELIHIEHRYISANWTLYYNKVGTAEIHLNAFGGATDVVMQHDELLIMQNGMQAIITNKEFTDECILYGRTLGYMLGWGVNQNFGEQTGTAGEMANSFLAQSLPWIQAEPPEGFSKQVSIVREEYTSTMELIQDCLAMDSGGYAVSFDNDCFVFRAYKGKELSLILSEGNRNATDTTYTEDRLEYATGGWYKKELPDNEDGSKPDPAYVWTHIPEPTPQKGFYYRDVVLDATTEAEAKEELAKKQIEKKTKATTFDVLYGRDYQLGDIVRIQKRLGDLVQTRKSRITGVNIWYEDNDFGQQPIFEEVEQNGVQE